MPSKLSANLALKVSLSLLSAASLAIVAASLASTSASIAGSGCDSRNRDSNVGSSGSGGEGGRMAWDASSRAFRGDGR
jgi:hypothetical protein